MFCDFLSNAVADFLLFSVDILRVSLYGFPWVADLPCASILQRRFTSYLFPPARRITSLPPHFLSSPQKRQQDLGGAAKAAAVALDSAVKAEIVAVGGAVKTAANLSGGVLGFKRLPDLIGSD
ncbi:hypothetical protein Droror1_Dr00026303 [Drosera rotundifolia]